ncbi:hypothetical protein Pint_17505 [Pistacia integerrima]|uniref:Uncharacterized protein n=1 Tax=Pistacia integerrima TaxID=434235 RepID=A0ACC0Z231_9ROSI|nr:hypothetical protein Pint_17505 [Pistacia integerrima]
MNIMPSNHTKFSSLVLLFVFLFLRNGDCGQIVRTLPGYTGTLPFKLERGYVSVGDSELFYLFVESQGNPEICPNFNVYYMYVFYIGPLQFNQTDYTGGLPSLHLYPYTWTKTASIVFVDSPVGSGYSYASTAAGFVLSDSKFANQTYNFMRTWLNEHPQYIPNRVVLATDSYSGIVAPIVVQKILEDNKAGVEPSISILGYISGSPHSDLELEVNDEMPQAHQLGLISKAIYESAKDYCNGSYVDWDSTTISADCEQYLEIIDNLTEQINGEMVLAPKCATIKPKSDNDRRKRRFLKENSKHYRLPPGANDYWCKDFAYLLSTIWANDKGVQSALHVREVLTYIQEYGDHDLVVPHISTEYWLTELDITLDEDWRPWYVGGQVAGYTMKYSNYGYRLTYATSKGSGHSPTEWKGRESYEMFERWIHFYPL